MWSLDAGLPREHWIQAIQESKAILQTSSIILAQEGGAALDTEQDPELWNLDEDEERMANLRRNACSRLRTESTRARSRSLH